MSSSLSVPLPSAVSCHDDAAWASVLSLEDSRPADRKMGLALSAIRRTFLGRGRLLDRGRLGRVCDLAGDLDDVAVRIEDPALAVGAVPSGEDLADALELALRSELARVRLDVAQGAPDELRHRHA